MLLTMFILSGILIVSLAAADLIFLGIRMNRLTGYSNIAFFASEAGMERALWEARKNGYVLPSSSQNNIFESLNIGNSSAYHVNYATSTPDVFLKSIGDYLGVKRSVETVYQTQ